MKEKIPENWARRLKDVDYELVLVKKINTKKKLKKKKMKHAHSRIKDLLVIKSWIL